MHRFQNCWTETIKFLFQFGYCICEWFIAFFNCPVIRRKLFEFSFSILINSSSLSFIWVFLLFSSSRNYFRCSPVLSALILFGVLVHTTGDNDRFDDMVGNSSSSSWDLLVKTDWNTGHTDWAMPHSRTMFSSIAVSWCLVNGPPPVALDSALFWLRVRLYETKS